MATVVLTRCATQIRAFLPEVTQSCFAEPSTMAIDHNLGNTDEFLHAGTGASTHEAAGSSTLVKKAMQSTISPRVQSPFSSKMPTDRRSSSLISTRVISSARWDCLVRASGPLGLKQRPNMKLLNSPEPDQDVKQTTYVTSENSSASFSPGSSARMNASPTRKLLIPRDLMAPTSDLV